jgi:hypothetical protein
MTRRRLMLLALAVSATATMAAASGAQARVGMASAARAQRSVASVSSTTPDPTCVLHSLRRFREAGEFGTHSSVADVITVECEPEFAESTVTLTADELASRCAGGVTWATATGVTGGAPLFVTGPSFDVTLDNDGEATAVLWGGPSCAAGTSIISAHLDVPPFATVHTTYTILAPGDTPEGVRARPPRQVEDSVTSSAATIVYAEFPSVFAERGITIRSNELNTRCAGGVTWVGPAPMGGLPTVLGTGPTTTTTLDNNGNAFVVALAGPSCSPGTSSIEASLNIAPFTSYLGSFNILSPRVTNP